MKYFILILIHLLVLNINCFKKTSTVNDTPAGYINSMAISPYVYNLINNCLSSEVNEMVKNGIDPYDGMRYVDYLSVGIDTILWDSSLSKVVFFVINKYKRKQNWETVKGEAVDTGPAIRYDADCFLATLKWTNTRVQSCKIKYYEILNFGDYDDVPSLSRRIREAYFKEFSSLKMEDCRYNFNDVRMWREPIWDKLFQPD